jgi:hypothetical protein
MEIVELTEKEYSSLVGKNVPVYNKPEFLNTNADKVDRIHYLSGKDKKHRVLLAIGEKDGEWRAPFSAPFSNIILLRDDISIKHIWDFVKSLIAYVKEQGGKLINFYLPADIYGACQNARIYNALLGNGFHVVFQDVNYSFNLTSFDMDSYEQLIDTNARRNLRIAMESNDIFVRCETDSEKEEAFDVIKANRESKGYPLRMTKEKLMETIKVVDHDFFLVKHEGRTLASAVVYKIKPKVAHLLYWGDIPDVGEFKSINFISYNLIKYYKNLGFDILDIGISTVDGIPNTGLCDFKESIGCIPSSKVRFQIEL